MTNYYQEAIEATQSELGTPETAASAHIFFRRSLEILLATRAPFGDLEWDDAFATITNHIDSAREQMLAESGSTLKVA